MKQRLAFAAARLDGRASYRLSSRAGLLKDPTNRTTNDFMTKISANTPDASS
jgi:hypothetical protein